MATYSKTLLDRPELAAELVDIAANCIRRLAAGNLSKEEVTSLNYAVTGVYRILPYIVVPRATIENGFSIPDAADDGTADGALS